MPADKLILLTGATGYVGGRLLPRLAADGWRVRCLARHPKSLAARVPAGVEVVPGDVLDVASLARAMEGVEAAYYMVHSMGATGDFAAQDRIAADHFAAAARAAGVRRRIIYLGGLGEEDPGLSAHLRSRHEVGERLRAHGVPVVELRASIIIGSGSLSFEMIRALVERLPVMVTPRWVRVKAQPIAIADVLDYLRGALTVENGDRHLTIETVFAAVERIGGATGWYYANWLWTLRGWLDLLAGGVGMRRGRRDPQRVLVGDTLDCWRIECIEPGERLRLAAEMKLPGRAWLEFELQPLDGGTELRQTATFDPLGLLGLIYWYAVWPLHQLVFVGMLRGIAHAAEKNVTRPKLHEHGNHAG